MLIMLIGDGLTHLGVPDILASVVAPSTATRRRSSTFDLTEPIMLALVSWLFGVLSVV